MCLTAGSLRELAMLCEDGSQRQGNPQLPPDLHGCGGNDNAGARCDVVSVRISSGQLFMKHFEDCGASMCSSCLDWDTYPLVRHAVRLHVSLVLPAAIGVYLWSLRQLGPRSGISLSAPKGEGALRFARRKQDSDTVGGSPPLVVGFWIAKCPSIRECLCHLIKPGPW